MSLTTRMMFRRLRGKKFSAALSSFIIAWALAMMVAGLYSSAVIRTSTSTYLEENGMPDLSVSLYQDRSPAEIKGVLGQMPVKAYDLRLSLSGKAMLNGTVLQVTLIGIADPNRNDIDRLTLLEGRMFALPFEGVAVAGGEDLGSTVQMIVGGASFQLNLTGVVRSPEYLLNELKAGPLVPGGGGETIVYVPLSTLQSVSGQSINEIALMLEPSSREQVAAAMASLPVSSMTFREDQPTVTLMQMGANKMAVMLPSISVVFVLIGAVSIFMTMYRLVVSDSRNIGVLMSLGVERRRIAVSYMGLGAVTLFLGGTLGCVLGYGFTVAICRLALGMMGNVPMVMPLDMASFLIGLPLVCAMVLPAVLVPVALVLRKNIREALSYVPKTRVWSLKRSLRSLAAVLGARNLLREPRRAAVVMLAIGLTIGAAGSWLVLLDSSMSYVNEQSRSYQWDVAISFASPVDANEAVVRFTDDLTQRVMPYTTFACLALAGDRSVGAVLTASPDMSGIRTFDLRSGSLDFSGAVMAKKIADELGVGPGDKISLVLGGTTIELAVTGVVNDLQTKAIYTSNGQALSVLGGNVCQGVFVALRSSDQTTSYISSVSSDPSVASIEPREKVIGSLNGLLSGALSLFYAYFALNMLIALAVATSAVVVSTSEREMEFTAISSLGLSRAFVLKSLMVEVGLLGLISALMAVPFAFLMAQGFAALIEEAVFFIPIWLTGISALTVFLAGWLFIMPSVAWPIRWSRRLDIVRTLRERLS